MDTWALEQVNSEVSLVMGPIASTQSETSDSNYFDCTRTEGVESPIYPTIAVAINAAAAHKRPAAIHCQKLKKKA
jgi:hypothetical protein